VNCDLIKNTVAVFFLWNMFSSSRYISRGLLTQIRAHWESLDPYIGVVGSSTPITI
jgi:hypothetical protein